MQEEIVVSLVLLTGWPLLTYAACQRWQNGKRAEAFGSLMAGWGLGGLAFLIWLYRLLRTSLPNVAATLLLPLAAGLGVMGLIGWLWLAILYIGEWLGNGESNRWSGG